LAIFGLDIYLMQDLLNDLADGRDDWRFGEDLDNLRLRDRRSSVASDAPAIHAPAMSSSAVGGRRLVGA
jgi:hypothetical protein